MKNFNWIHICFFYFFFFFCQSRVIPKLKNKSKSDDRADFAQITFPMAWAARPGHFPSWHYNLWPLTASKKGPRKWRICLGGARVRPKHAHRVSSHMLLAKTQAPTCFSHQSLGSADNEGKQSLQSPTPGLTDCSTEMPLLFWNRIPRSGPG